MTLNFINPDYRLDEFLKRYRQVFSQEYIQRLMACVPTYMILDDHEIEDNWPSNATKKDQVTLYPHAIHAYQIYQCSHSPLFNDNQGRIYGIPSRFWYTFSDGCGDWFVMDLRTERILVRHRNKMISDIQLQALLDWLGNDSEKIKFVVSSVPLFPDIGSDADDGWSAFSTQRQIILNHIFNHKIRKVVFVSGDVHCSFTSELRLSDEPDFIVYGIVSSSFFWPYPHMSESDFIFDHPLTGADSQKYTSKLTSPIFSEDNFARIEAKPSGVKVTFYERKGQKLGKTIHLKF